MLETLASWHHFIVHFSVAFTIGSAGFDIIDFFFPRKRFEETGFLLMVTAIPFLLLAVLTGNLAASHAPGLEQAAIALEHHIRYANIAVWIFCAAGLWRVFLHFKRRYNGKNKVMYMFVIATAAASVYLAALHGGSIRHTFPESRQPSPTVLRGMPFPLDLMLSTHDTAHLRHSPVRRSQYFFSFSDTFLFVDG
ncbi:MAG: hypothetical protein KFH87_02905 [Bacteroidetes bacterium]|nr:hypothetical protein [Bacteroidota bacterium]